MSSEGDNAKSISSETNDKSVTDTTDSSQDSQDLKDEKPEKVNDEKGEGDAKGKESTSSATENSEKPKNDVGKDAKSDGEEKVNDVDEKKKDEKAEKEDTEEGEGSEKEDDEEGSEKDDDEKKKPLLDQPLEQSGTRERKKVQRFNEEAAKDSKDVPKTEIPAGNGTPLGEIPRIDASISRFKNDDLRLLHRLLFKNPGKTAMIKKNIRKFNGFDFKKDTEEYSKKIAAGQKFEIKQLKSICEMLDLDKKGVKDEITERIVDFLLEPKDSGKPVPGGRPKRSAAVRANNRGYTSHDDYSSDEKLTTRAHRDKGKRPNLKDESSSESDEDFHPSDASDERPRVNKRQTKRRKQLSDDEASELEDSPSSEESDEEPKSKRKRGSVKVANNKAGKGKATPGRRGRKPGPGPAQKKKSSPKRGRKPAKDSSEEESEEEEAHDDASSSEDEPLVKKAKSQPQPPTDEEIKTYVKEILEGANLEEITMKTVCKQVYAHYPDFDLSHKKDFIKSTVKSLIST